MTRRTRQEMIVETRAKLLAAGRQAFATLGYAEASMDDFTAEAGLTRGALYHHFGDKKGLFEAVVAEIDGEMTLRLKERAARAPSRWEGFVEEGIGYIEMALEPEIGRIMLRDGPAVMGDPASWPSANGCIMAMKTSLDALLAEGAIRDIDTEATARMVTGASCYAAQWIANAEDPVATSKRATAAYRQLVEGLLREAPERPH
ncbi:TetR family transcriptional regulator [Devosia yakushimensis]|uniref:TetR family transcriptional regulator n=1 Tax=Devosia yakushimensis TaxID=470028 RepID=A0ABQ5U7J9_9HYPH|nr:TetR/AcrR family transcriptional regulator [Devosia yakushimensis]GLQ08115.1 TetR family transcriptional regulator [Devosia yakushimensis]